MSPVPGSLLSTIKSRAIDPGIASSQFRTQWRNPSDVFSVLLILGGDIIQQALAQLAGSRITPIAFSFGWVAYGVSAISSAVGENKIMPMADCQCKVINAKSGFSRDNVAWIIGRVVRDFEYWMDRGRPDKPVQSKVNEMIDKSWAFQKEQAAKARERGEDYPEPERPIQAGLCVSVYRSLGVNVGDPGKDHLYYLGFATMVVQLGIAAIPCGLDGDYGQLLITAAGTILALCNGSFTQWRIEKWTARKNSDSKYILTRGNGAQHAIVILGDGVGLNWEDLSAVPTNVDVWTGTWTKVLTMVLGLLWICLLITASGLSENSWYLLAVGGIGIVENIYVAGARRTPQAFGLPLELVEVIGEPKVMKTLFEVEKKYPYAGWGMLNTFFPGDLHENEQTQWNDLRASAKSRDKEWRERRREELARLRIGEKR